MLSSPSLLIVAFGCRLLRKSENALLSFKLPSRTACPSLLDFNTKKTMSDFRSIPVLARSSINAFDVAGIVLSDINSLYHQVFFISSHGNFESKDLVLRSTITAASLGIIFPRLFFLLQEIMSIENNPISDISLIYFIKVFFINY